MQLQFFCPRWGSEQYGWDDLFTRIRAEGYDGLEYSIAADTSRQELDSVWNSAERHNSRIIAQHYDTADPDFNRHFDKYSAWIDKIKVYPMLKLNTQTGRDFFNFEQNRALIEASMRAMAGTGIKILHETHRGKFSFAAHVTKEYLEKIPALELTLDASHWVNVSETFLEDQPAAMALAIERTGHIHARVGYPEGPQISDPRVPEWRHALDHHLVWWDAVAERFRQDSSSGPLTIAPEFGPYPYLVELPFTRQPITSQWEVNAWMMRLLKDRYKK